MVLLWLLVVIAWMAGFESGRYGTESRWAYAARFLLGVIAVYLGLTGLAWLGK